MPDSQDVLLSDDWYTEELTPKTTADGDQTTADDLTQSSTTEQHLVSHEGSGNGNADTINRHSDVTVGDSGDRAQQDQSFQYDSLEDEISEETTVRENEDGTDTSQAELFEEEVNHEHTSGAEDDLFVDWTDEEDASTEKQNFVSSEIIKRNLTFNVYRSKEHIMASLFKN